MGHQNSALPETGTYDENDPNYVAGGDPNQAPAAVPAWKQYLNRMGSMMGQQPKSRQQSWSNAGANISKALMNRFSGGEE